MLDCYVGTMLIADYNVDGWRTDFAALGLRVVENGGVRLVACVGLLVRARNPSVSRSDAWYAARARRAADSFIGY